ncbi:hypothetical protein AX774_g2822 [Zancudomyces culisetae]|uniref:UspA domain-containing protein n=1 Tax=Zancudomyces culisetae TaxID=1213189 RepID=A0A1R1PRT1_ZANCU|nr:hypothetical protein AX774_g2822 [Zancudomyces culisetae]|eukprot:OMH83661.1 hypothetical protein AX774_g2822 [Zancudomyces culisetae]
MATEESKVKAQVEEVTSGLDVVSINPSKAPEKILSLEQRRLVGFCFDNSETANYAYSWSFRHALLPYQDHVYLLCSLESSSNTMRDSLNNVRTVDPAKIIESRAAEISKELLTIGITSQLIISSVEPKKFIRSSVESLGIQTLIIGSRGNNVVKRFVMGSVSTYILNKVEVPIIVIKLPKKGDRGYDDSQLEIVNTRDSLRLVKTKSKDDRNVSFGLARTRTRDSSF